MKKVLAALFIALAGVSSVACGQPQGCYEYDD